MKIYYTHRVEADNDPHHRQSSLSLTELELFLESQYEAGKRAVPLKRALRSAKEEEYDDVFCITFDDGYNDIIKHALPLLEEYSIPFTVFVTTGFLTREYIPVEYFESKVCTEGTSRQARLLHKLAKNTPPFVRRIISSFSHYEPSTIDCDELRYLCQHPLVTIGAHGVSHVNLSYMPLKTVKSEIVKSKTFLDCRLDIDVDVFSYPYGGYRSSFGYILENAGFQYALTTNISVTNTPCRWSIPRVKVKKKVNSILRAQ